MMGVLAVAMCTGCYSLRPPADGDGGADAELCNGVDDDRDGDIDEGDPGAGFPCSSGLVGACFLGVGHCVEGAVACVPNVAPVAETCANAGNDDDCDGVVDDVPGVGEPCESDQPGRCAPGEGFCDGDVFGCLPVDEPRAERCGNAIDDDCDGDADEDDCEDVLTCDELEDPAEAAMEACLRVFAFCWDTILAGGGTGVVGTTREGRAGENCGPPEDWQMFCYATAYDEWHCGECVLGEIRRSHDPCNCGNTPAIGQWCPTE
jgi:hypothetical protein